MPFKLNLADFSAVLQLDVAAKGEDFSGIYWTDGQRHERIE
jgi:hypothetical protein